MSRKQLVLDAGGVVITNLTLFWTLIGEASGRPHADVKAAFAAEIRDGFWSGSLPEADFWRWLGGSCPGLPEREARECLRRAIRPLPAFQCIPAWSRLADVHILSNHRAEWLSPCLAPIRPYVRHVVISSEAGAVKPSDAIFERLLRKLDPADPVLYVDDQRKNAAAAERAGWHGLLADEREAWIDRVNRWLAP